MDMRYIKKYTCHSKTPVKKIANWDEETSINPPSNKKKSPKV